MELKFNKEGEKFAAEFKVDADFNLHIERKRGGTILFYQRTSEGGDYGIIDGMRQYDSRGVIDVDFTALVYPKYIKIVDAAEPTSAIVTTEGNVEQILPPRPMIKFTINNPEGYGSEYECEEGMTWGEWNTRAGVYEDIGTYFQRFDSAYPNFYVYPYDGDVLVKPTDVIKAGYTYGEKDELIKETISFFIYGDGQGAGRPAVEYQAEQGMSWKDWVNSPYNTARFVESEKTVVDSQNLYGIYDENGWLFSPRNGEQVENFIRSGYEYKTWYEFESAPEW